MLKSRHIATRVLTKHVKSVVVVGPIIANNVRSQKRSFGLVAGNVALLKLMRHSSMMNQYTNTQIRNYAIRELKMPALSPTMEKGNIKEWVAKVGDKLGPGDVLCTVETDKATLDFTTEEDLVLAKIIVPAGTNDVPLGSVLALVGDDPADLANVDSFKVSSSPAKQSKQQTEQRTEPQQPQQQQQEDEYEEVEEEVPGTGAASSLPKGAKEIKMPSLSPTMKSGNLVKWTVSEGQEVKAGDVIAEIETDKATLDFEFPDDGIIGKILVSDNTKDISLGTPLAILVQNKSDVDALKSYTPGAESAPQKRVVRRKKAPSQQQEQQMQQQTQQRTLGERIFASPLAKTVAKEKGIDLSGVAGTGPNGRIIKADVEELTQKPRQVVQQVQQVQKEVQPKPALAPAVGDYTDIPTSNIRRVIAERLMESKRNIPHYYVTVECQLDGLMKVRNELNKAGEKRGFKLSVNDFIIKAAALAMKKVPAVNSSWQGDFIRQYHNVDVSVAVSTDNGLITPIVTSAEKRGLADISEQVKTLAEKARQGKLQPHEFQGGTFTISNLGMYGVTEFSAIINPPQSCILAIGGAEKKVVPNESYKGLEGEDKFKVVNVMKVTISADHRVVDGATAAQWLQEFKALIENPLFLML